MVGDQENDMLFGRNFGCKTVQVLGDADRSEFADYYSDTLESAARWILREKDRKDA
jgi:phosphoglycolate phosphatase-like HAD superfamily hydrolase